MHRLCPHPEGDRKKLDSKAAKFRFIGYTESTKNYKVWNEVKQRCYIRHDLVFNEGDFDKSNTCTLKEMLHEDSTDNEESTRTVLLDTSEGQETTEDEEEPPTQPTLRRSQRTKQLSVRYGIDEYANRVCHCAYQATEIKEPATIQET